MLYYCIHCGFPNTGLTKPEKCSSCKSNMSLSSSLSKKIVPVVAKKTYEDDEELLERLLAKSRLNKPKERYVEESPSDKKRVLKRPSKFSQGEDYSDNDDYDDDDDNIELPDITELKFKISNSDSPNKRGMTLGQAIDNPIERKNTNHSVPTTKLSKAASKRKLDAILDKAGRQKVKRGE